MDMNDNRYSATMHPRGGGKTLSKQENAGLPDIPDDLPPAEKRKIVERYLREQLREAGVTVPERKLQHAISMAMLELKNKMEKEKSE